MVYLARQSEGKLWRKEVDFEDQCTSYTREVPTLPGSGPLTLRIEDFSSFAHRNSPPEVVLAGAHASSPNYAFFAGYNSRRRELFGNPFNIKDAQQMTRRDLICLILLKEKFQSAAAEHPELEEDLACIFEILDLEYQYALI